MSAIDFDMMIERQPDPRGDRLRITMSGKFLPFKYYGASGNVSEYGYKEELFGVACRAIQTHLQEIVYRIKVLQ